MVELPCAALRRTLAIIVAPVLAHTPQSPNLQAEDGVTLLKEANLVQSNPRWSLTQGHRTGTNDAADAERCLGTPNT